MTLSFMGSATAQPLATSPPQLPSTGTVEQLPHSDIKLVMSEAAPSVQFHGPTLFGPGEFAMDGAVCGAAAPVLLGVAFARMPPPVAGLALFGAGLAAAPPGALLGAVSGALTGLAAQSRAEVEVSTAALERAVTNMRVSDALVAQILEAGRSYKTLTSELADAPTTVPADTLVEIGNAQIALASSGQGSHGLPGLAGVLLDVCADHKWIPDLKLQVAFYVRLVRMSDGEEVRRGWWWKHESDTARLGEWSKDDARLFRDELERGLRAVALQAVNDLVPVREPTQNR